MSVSEGDGGFEHLGGDEKGDVESSLTSLLPYAKVALNDRLDLWGILGAGSGEVTLSRERAGVVVEVLRTDIAMRMGAVGLRGEVLRPSRTDATALAGVAERVRKPPRCSSRCAFI